MSATASAKDAMGRIAWGLSTAALCVTAGAVSVKVGRIACMRKCKQVILGLYHGVQEESLAQAQNCSLDGYAFQVFWWSSYLLTQKSASDE